MSSYALIVAADSYRDPELSKLRAPSHDARELGQVLADPEIGAFDVRLVVNQPAHVVCEEIDNFFADRQLDDLLLLYFSCHGVKDDAGRLYFASSNTTLNRLASSAVSSVFVNEQIDRSRSRKIVLLLDCCFSGAFIRGMTPRATNRVDFERFEGRGRAVITASTAMEYAFESGEETLGAGRPSIFTHALVEGLRSGDADRDRDGRVSVDELYDYVYDRVREETPNQTPGKVINVHGELFIARNPNLVLAKPALLPPEILVALDNPISGVRAGVIPDLGRFLQSPNEGLSSAARLALERLVDDDSRMVSAAATAALSSVAPSAQPPPPPRQGTSPPPSKADNLSAPERAERYQLPEWWILAFLLSGLLSVLSLVFGSFSTMGLIALSSVLSWLGLVGLTAWCKFASRTTAYRYLYRWLAIIPVLSIACFNSWFLWAIISWYFNDLMFLIFGATQALAGITNLIIAVRIIRSRDDGPSRRGPDLHRGRNG